MKVKVEKVMSKKLIVGYVPGKVEGALEILAKHNVSGIPILKEGTKKVVGVVTRSDIFRNADEDQIALIMSDNVHFVYSDQDVKDAARLLFENRIHGLPVTNKTNDIVGIISPTDMLKILPEKSDVIGQYYTNSVVPVYEDTPINIIMEIINITNKNVLPVLNNDLKISGIVSDGDLFKLNQVRENMSNSVMGLGEDEDQWSWEGIRDTTRLYYSTTEVALPPIPVKKVMIHNVLKAFENTSVIEAAQKMIKHKISHMPVVNASDRLIGMVTDTDLMACMF
jgi:CBS domain-containing protein